MNYSLKQYFNEILERINYIEQFVGGYTYENFEQDEKTIAACTMYIQVIGEYASKIKKKFPDITTKLPLEEMIGMRNIISHDYANLFTTEIRNIIKNDLPNLLLIIKKELELL